MGINDYEIKKLVSMNVLVKQERAAYQINEKVVKKLLLQELLENKEEVTRKQLLDFGLSDYEIRKMLKNGTLFQLSRGVFTTRRENIKPEINIILTPIEKLQKAFTEKNVTEILKTIDEVSNEDYLPLSKEVLKLLITTVFSNEKDITTERETVTEELPVEEKKEIIKEVIEDVDLPSPSKEEIKEPVKIVSNVEPIKIMPKLPQTETMSLEKLWNLYSINAKSKPILAKGYLERYKELCKQQNVAFDYYELITNGNRIANLALSTEEKEEATKLTKEIHSLLSQPANEKNRERLQQSIDRYREIDQDRIFYGKYYQGCYERKYKNYSKAERIFEEILKENPENVLVLREICKLYCFQRKFKKCEEKANQYLNLDVNDISIYLNLIRCYLANKKVYKIDNLTNRIMYNDKIDITRYLKTVIGLLNKKIEGLKEKSYRVPNLTNLLFAEIKELQRSLEEHQDILNQVLCNKQKTTDSILDEYDLECYIDEVYDCVCNNDGNINISNIKPYVENLNISLDERMLLYIAAAKLLFENKFPKQGQEYLNIVEHTEGKSSFVIEQHQRCQRNKSLYLNKQKKF